jgi:uncharacterized YigZ family protein
MEEDEFLTIKAKQTAEIKVKGSRFIGTAHPVTTLDETSNYIQQLSNQFYDASHNCYAFQVGQFSSVIARYSDAGEPAGTAGIPILNVLKGKNLTDILIVVTRYFGGTKLGRGGLIRAYSDCATTVLDRCSIIKKYIYKTVNVTFEYDLTGAVMRVIDSNSAIIANSKYDRQTRLTLSIRKGNFESIKSKLIEASSGRIHIEEEPGDQVG